jgi:hypothetical protein
MGRSERVGINSYLSLIPRWSSFGHARRYLLMTSISTRTTWVHHQVDTGICIYIDVFVQLSPVKFKQSYSIHPNRRIIPSPLF